MSIILGNLNTGNVPEVGPTLRDSRAITGPSFSV